MYMSDTRDESQYVSAHKWLPALDRKVVNIPRTVFVNASRENLFNFMEDEEDLHCFQNLKDAGDIVGWPFFLRTNMASAKHCGPVAFKVESEDDIRRAAGLTFQDNVIKSIDLNFDSFMVRSWLDLEHAFTAFDGLPISAEWRVLCDGYSISKDGFYWPKDAIKDADVEDWEDKLDQFRAVTFAAFTESGCYEKAAQSVQAVNKRLGTNYMEWSVDFAMDKNKKWWLIDMAPAAVSWRP